jgi:hypothetical protein
MVLPALAADAENMRAIREWDRVVSLIAALDQPETSPGAAFRGWSRRGLNNSEIPMNFVSSSRPVSRPTEAR